MKRKEMIINRNMDINNINIFFDKNKKLEFKIKYIFYKFKKPILIRCCKKLLSYLFKNIHICI